MTTTVSATRAGWPNIIGLAQLSRFCKRSHPGCKKSARPSLQHQGSLQAYARVRCDDNTGPEVHVMWG